MEKTITPNQSSIVLNERQQAYRKKMLNPWLFRLFTLFKVPLGFIGRMRMESLDSQQCQASIPFLWVNKNPFKSIYFVAQAMAAELSTAALCLLAIEGRKPSVATIVVGLEAEFHKKGTGRTYFTCTDGEKIFEAVEKASQSNEAVSVSCKTEGYMKDGTHVSTFYISWSFKKRS